MKVITIVEGRVPASKAAELESSYLGLKKSGSFPLGLLVSYLLRNSSDPELYTVQTIWASREALDKMRSTSQVPVAVAIFQNIGVKPTVEIQEVKDSLP